MKHNAVLKQDFRSGTCIDVCMEFRDEGICLTLPSLMYCSCLYWYFIVLCKVTLMELANITVYGSHKRVCFTV